MATPGGMGKKICQRTYSLADVAAFSRLAFRFHPYLWLAQEERNRNCKDHRRCACEEDESPAGVTVIKIRLPGPNPGAQQGTGDISESRKGLHDAERECADVARHALGDQGCGGAEHAADAQPAEETI